MGPRDAQTQGEAASPPSRASTTGTEGPGDQIGPYKLLSLLGEGGFGAVWLAERREPFVQRVALKVIKPGMDSKAVLARFEQERQALAVMNHPSIAKVLDGGLTPSGRPYFAMEHVHGEPITEFCDRLKLGIDERLRLFAEVCEAIQHAHAKGLVHRDIKPGNILAFRGDGDAPCLKVIDFGVAKAMSHGLAAHTVVTEAGIMIGTLEYMSPEQTEGGHDIDTRSDIYSLGVLLYELLTGEPPFSGPELRRKTYAEVQRTLREVDPPTPSRRLATVATRDHEFGSQIEAARRVTLAELVRRLRKELEWIPLKAMRKEREQRYQTAHEMATDIHAYLDGRPISAAPESTAYRLRVYARRHRALVAGAACVLGALVLGLGLATWQWRTADIARMQALERAEQLKAVSGFQSSMLAQLNPTRAGQELFTDLARRYAQALAAEGLDETACRARTDAFVAELAKLNATDTASGMIDQMMLQPAVGVIEREFANQPEVAAQLQQTLADAYRALGRYGSWEPLQAAALDTRRRTLGMDHPDTLQSLHSMGVLLDLQGKRQEATACMEDAAARRKRLLGPRHPDTLRSINSLGVLLQGQDRYDEALPYFMEALEGFCEVRGPDDPISVRALGNVGVCLQSAERFKEAEPYLKEALERSRRINGDADPLTTQSAFRYGVLLMNGGDLTQAAPVLESAHAGTRQLLGDEHPDTLECLNALSHLALKQGDRELALARARAVVEHAGRSLGASHPLTRAYAERLQQLLDAPPPAKTTGDGVSP